MTVPRIVYPALYTSADTSSFNAQRGSLWTIRAEYSVLLLVSISLAFRDRFPASRLIITLMLLFLAGLFVVKVLQKNDQDWYKSRALAESVKTSTWRFCMRAHPFDDTGSVDVPKRTFRELLQEILRTNQTLAQGLSTEGTDQVTESMIIIRRMSLQDRLSFYVTNRIADQEKWYTKKSLANRKALRTWIAITILLYFLATVALYGDQIGFPEIIRVFDPLIVLVTSIVGWIQLKRYGELIASYNLAAHEIGIIRSSSEGITSEQEFSDFVNEAELAFSREHTQWVARRDAS